MEWLKTLGQRSQNGKIFWDNWQVIVWKLYSTGIKYIVIDIYRGIQCWTKQSSHIICLWSKYTIAIFWLMKTGNDHKRRLKWKLFAIIRNSEYLLCLFWSFHNNRLLFTHGDVTFASEGLQRCRAVNDKIGPVHWSINENG